MVVHLDSGRVSRDRPYSGYSYAVYIFQRRGFHPLWPPFPGSFAYTYTTILESYNPISMLMVWAHPRSLATTKGISIDFFFLAT
jgi:hypothetical protein